MVTILKKEKNRSNSCISCHKSEVDIYDLEIIPNKYSSTKIPLCKECLEKLKEKIEEITCN